MVFDKLKKLFAGSRPSVVVAARTDDAAVLQAALLPLVAHSRVLADRCVAFVRDGSDPGVLWDLEHAANPELVQLLHNPARLDPWWWAAESTRKAWEGLGLTPDHVLQGRHNYYGASHPPEELVRLGRLLAALATEVNRQADGVPLWLTALLNDVVATIPNRAAGRESIMQALPQWQAGFVVQLLSVDGEAGGDEAAVALRALIQASPDSGYRRFQPHELPGVRELILSCGRLSPSQVAGLNAEARVWLMQKAADEVGVGEALSDVVAAYTVDTAKSVRAAALNALSRLSQQCRAEAIAPVLARASASRAADLVEALSRDPQGTRLLAEAVEGGAKIGALVAQSTQRMEAIEAKDDGQPVLVPPFTPLPDTPAGPEVVDQLRAALDAEIARAQGKNITWAQRAMEKERGINRTQLEQVVAAANGAQVEVKLLKEYNL
ncbi:hypothetical protein [Tessaracoccus caeni]|uniref:hypothetical protein n=1 Tax=Tessaracoccus caeni TaxID=3031239 RepID=UPI0023DA352B|nr:hypothetical protein [Tessaracoccus caeni]MDF1488944.1 hypothetical protein [Tessaracoccus caeni]